VCLCFNGVANLETAGTLAVTTQAVRWLHPSGDRSRNVRVMFRQISMHAVSRDTTAFPAACIYMQVDGVDGVVPERPSGGEAEADEEEEEEEQVTEVHIVPADPASRK
jgi:nucleotide-sensitive chloride channel 1A